MKDWYEFMDRTTRRAIVRGVGTYPDLASTHRWDARSGYWIRKGAKLLRTSSGLVTVARPRPHKPYKSPSLS